jgi:choline dehydrogenase-like flavoprotein
MCSLPSSPACASQVSGVDALRVVDASIMPFITNGNVHSTVVMVAERAAELVLLRQQQYSALKDMARSAKAGGG